MKPVAQRGGGSSILFETAPDRGRVLVRDEATLYPELNIHGIIAHGYWEPFTGDAEQAIAEARRATELEPPRRRLRAAS